MLAERPECTFEVTPAYFFYNLVLDGDDVPLSPILVDESGLNGLIASLTSSFSCLLTYNLLLFRMLKGSKKFLLFIRIAATCPIFGVPPPLLCDCNVLDFDNFRFLTPKSFG